MSDDKLEPIIDKIAPLVRMLASNEDHEALGAARAINRVLTKQGLDFNDFADWIENDGESPLSAGEMQKIYDQAYEKGFTDGSEHGRLSAVVAAQSIGVFAKPIASATGPGINGYTWDQIAAHCALNKHLFSGKARQFVEDMPEKLQRFRNPTPGQADYLRDLFMQKCGGRI